MNRKILLILFFTCSLNAYAQAPRIESLFDDSWKFHLGDIPGAEKLSFNDKTWRDIDLPHDWSIEHLPGQEAGKVVGPFHKESPGTTATGYTLGGTGWYRKTFVLDKQTFTSTILNFDGVYMNCIVWVNGKEVGTHPYGYTAFQLDITKYLQPAGKPNVIAVKVRNEGQNSRWYSGSGIYRHVWLIRKNAVNIPHHGVFVSTENISANEAVVKVSTVVTNQKTKTAVTKLSFRVIGPDGKDYPLVESQAKSISTGEEEFVQRITVSQPKLWSTEKPNLYKMEVTVHADGAITDRSITTFGIRTIHFDTQTGFTLNGKKVLLKGGNMHHDNGFLGSATIDRAEERRVELMKAYGFNAIRTSHNPPSQQFLDACDRLGVLVMDEAFDMWERPKNPQDYHLYFKEWWKEDLKSMIYRDRNHPSVIFWSIGNELNERADTSGFRIRKKLVAEAHRLDATRPVTEGVCNFWDHPGQQWSTTAPAFADLDVGGYNYLDKQYEADHAQFPERIMVGTESYAGEANNYWRQVEKNSWVLGDFVWTAMDHLGETGCGNARYTDNPMRVGLQPWPWFVSFAGDIDLCGDKKPQMLYRDVVWGNSKLAMMVHEPVPQGKKEVVSYWGWPNEIPSWNWEVNEGKEMEVRVFTRYPHVRLERNGKIIGEKSVHDSTRITATFSVPYEPGVLRAIALENGIEVASKELRTTGAPAQIKLIADRTKIKADRNDLSYVRVEVTDAQGNFIPDAAIPITFIVSGVGEMAGSGNANPTDMESFNNRNCKTHYGRALAILRPLKGKKSGTITLKAEAKGLVAGEVSITVE